MTNLPGPPLTSARPLTSLKELLYSEAACSCRLLSQIYSAAVQAVLSGIKCYSSTTSAAKVSLQRKWRRCSCHGDSLLFQAKDVAENTFVMALDALDLSLYRSSLRCGLVHSPGNFETRNETSRPLFPSSDPDVTLTSRRWTTRAGAYCCVWACFSSPGRHLDPVFVRSRIVPLTDAESRLVVKTVRWERRRPGLLFFCAQTSSSSFSGLRDRA